MRTPPRMRTLRVRFLALYRRNLSKSDGISIDRDFTTMRPATLPARLLPAAPARATGGEHSLVLDKRPPLAARHAPAFLPMLCVDVNGDDHISGRARVVLPACWIVQAVTATLPGMVWRRLFTCCPYGAA